MNTVNCRCSTSWRESTPEEIMEDLKRVTKSIREEVLQNLPNIMFYDPSIFKDPISKVLGFTHYAKNSKMYRRGISK